ncbi:type IV secretory system conjugative DNA transfer family protein (plasmid) [Sphingomonas sp. AP4-R1]|uniref:type IV secretory system conjugative DNA transfer family protein n=1 Tax=Sphingomonas sp. AP4-R1 TaxID=2735134 RepID=UPI0014934384|nr:type IV secretory system conjugative DNA transfer family protein [Sphingomonas sp. AP4-R1]QJU60955.1 type IV secretory system conjugative DNA transfer family protein [Sphingomonas sp. AP4-R1]
MIWVRLTGRAFRNMLRWVARDPLSAVHAILFSPMRVLKHLIGVVVIFLVATLVLSSASTSLLYFAKVRDGSPIGSIVQIGTMLILVGLLFRALVKPMVMRFGFEGGDSDTHGSARFATRDETRALDRTDGLLIGRDLKTKRLMRYAGPAHLLTIAPTRSGKGVGTIIPNLLEYPFGLVCIDPKGENARIAARQRSRFGPVHILDPFGITGVVGAAAYNPLDRIDPQGLDHADDCMTLADALVHDAHNEMSEAHWNEEAKALIAGLLLHIVETEPLATRTLATLRDRLTLAPAAFEKLLNDMQAQGGLVARAANRHLGKSDREAAGVLSSAQRHTHFLDSPRMTAALGRSDFAFADIKSAPATIFLVLPPDRLDTYARWLRLMIAQALTELARVPGKAPWPVLFLLDEFAALGHLEPVERAMGLMAGYGIQLWPILQDIHQLRALYGQRAGTFLSNAGVLQIFGVNDQQSAQLVSDLLGQETVVFETVSRAIDAEESGLSFTQHHTARALLTPDEVRTLKPDRQLLFLAGQRPIIATKLRYYADREFAGRFDQA